MLNDIQKHILSVVADMASIPDGAVNIRSDGKKAYRHNTENIEITSKTDKDGIDIRIKPFTKHEDVHIPVVLTASGMHDMVYNDFFVGEGAEVRIVAGCGIHNCGDCDSQHDGIHTFYVGKNAKVTYIEKHYGEGEGSGKRILNPQTIVYLEGGRLHHDGDEPDRGRGRHEALHQCVASGAEFRGRHHGKAPDARRAARRIRDGRDPRRRRLPDARRFAQRRQERSTQIFYPRVQGNTACFGHVSCDAIIMGEAKVRAIPEISCNHVDAALIHEAAIGRIAGEQILKLETLGLTPEEAEEKILEGFLR